MNPIPGNIYIPEVIFGVKSDKFNEETDRISRFLYSLGEYGSILRSSEGGYYSQYSTFMNNYHKSVLPGRDFAKGVVPSALRKQVVAILNTPFKPQLRGISTEEDLLKYSDSYLWINFEDSHRNLDFSGMTEPDKNYCICNLGINKGVIISDSVIGFRYRVNEKFGDFLNHPVTLCLVRAEGEEYEQALRDSKLIRDFLKLTEGKDVKAKHLVPGRWYRRKGCINLAEKECWGREEGEKIVCYLGEWRFANGEHMRAPFKPGERYTRKPVFLSLMNAKQTPSGDWIIGRDTEVCSFNLNSILCEIPDFKDLTEETLKSLHDRFEYSMWSHKFWNTPGVVEKFFVQTKKDPGFMLTNSLGKRHLKYSTITSCSNLISSEIYKGDIGNIQDLEIGKRLDKVGYPRDITWGRSSSNYTVVTLKNSDTSKPLEIIPSKNQVGKTWGVSWVEDNKLESLKGLIPMDVFDSLYKGSTGISYQVRGKNYVFKAVIDFISAYNYSLANYAPGDSYNSLKVWPICSTIS